MYRNIFFADVWEYIRSHQIIAAVMTSSSMRPKSVCRDEVVFALNEGKSVVPIKANPDVHPTLLLARRNWIDISLIGLQYCTPNSNFGDCFAGEAGR